MTPESRASVVEVAARPPARAVSVDSSPLALGARADRKPPLRAITALPLLCLGATLVAGLVLAEKSVEREWALRALPMQRLQPLHTLLAIGFVLSGIAALLWLASARLEGRAPGGLGWVLTPSVALFLAAASATVLAGHGSGREYFGWAPATTPLLLGCLAAFVLFFFRRFRLFATASPEAAWLIGVGLLCMPLGVLEGHAYLIDRIPLDKGLSLEWHSLDIFFAGWNAALYGFGILVAGGKRTPLRATWLFLLAAFTFVSTFGHHHYVSSQPRVMKLIAVTASVLAGLSFVRHARTLARQRGRAAEAPAHPFLRSAERWTLMAIGSGIVLALPPVNLVLHGTYAVVAHSMVAMIGVNVMIVIAGLAELLDVPSDRLATLTRVARWANRLLLLLWLDLVVAGAFEGWMRFDRHFGVVKATAADLLVPLPALGFFLSLALGRVAWILFDAARRPVTASISEAAVLGD